MENISKKFLLAIVLLATTAYLPGCAAFVPVLLPSAVIHGTSLKTISALEDKYTPRLNDAALYEKATRCGKELGVKYWDLKYDKATHTCGGILLQNDIPLNSSTRGKSLKDIATNPSTLGMSSEDAKQAAYMYESISRCGREAGLKYWSYEYDKKSHACVPPMMEGGYGEY